jgi:hypothetical protein
LEDGNLYLRLRKMRHTIYAAKFEQTIIHQHVHLRRESQSHEAVHVLMRLYRRLIARLFTKRKKDVYLEFVIIQEVQFASFSSYRQCQVDTHHR